MKKIISQASIKKNLLISSLFITSFEILKGSIQDRIKEFLCRDVILNSNGELQYKDCGDYEAQIVKRKIPKINDKSYHLFYSSCLWLIENNTITQEEFEELEKIRKHRNKIAHNPLNFLIDDDININIDLLKKSQEILTKIEKWWIIEVEIPSNQSFDGENINEFDIQSGRIIILDYLMEIAHEEIN